MNIFCLDCSLAGPMRALGHTVLTPALPSGIAHAPSLLREHDFRPDLFIQQERLAPRLLLDRLDEVPCPTFFISVDAHLNMFWQERYARLFDVVFTPHISLFQALRPGLKPGRLVRLAPAGLDLPFLPHKRRPYPLSFVGLLTEHRPARGEMVRLLRRECGLRHPEQPVPYAAMLDLLRASRLVPNESIALEVNFRLFEAASCGALVLSQDMGADQEAFFRPGLEFVSYANGLELLDKVKFYLSRPAAAEAIARAGWERAQADYLPERRAALLLREAGLSRARLTGEEAAENFWLALAQLSRGGLLRLSVDWLLARRSQFAARPASMAMRLRLLLESSHPDNSLYGAAGGGSAASRREQAADLLAFMLKNSAHADSLECNLAGAMAAVFLERRDWARAFWLRQRSLLSGRTAAQAAPPASDAPYDQYLAWGRLLRLLGLRAQVGFAFNAQSGFIAQCSLECLLLAQAEAGDDQSKRLGCLEELHLLCRELPAFSWIDMGFLAELSLRRPGDWRAQLAYGLRALENYRLEAGLHEVAEARGKAAPAGEATAFAALLEEAPASRYIQATLPDIP